MSSDKYNELLKEYRRLAKRADQRLLELERLSKKSEYKGLVHFAYARAQRDISAWSGSKARRFNTKPPRTTQGIRAKIKDIEEFLEARTSTKSGIDKYYKEKQKVLADRFGVSKDWRDNVKLYRTGLNDILDKAYGHYTSLRVVGVIQRNKKSIRDAINKSKKDVTIGDVLADMRGESGVVKEAVADAVEKYAKQLRKAGIL